MQQQATEWQGSFIHQIIGFFHSINYKSLSTVPILNLLESILTHHMNDLFVGKWYHVNALVKTHLRVPTTGQNAKSFQGPQGLPCSVPCVPFSHAAGPQCTMTSFISLLSVTFSESLPPFLKEQPHNPYSLNLILFFSEHLFPPNTAAIALHISYYFFWSSVFPY